VEISTFSTLPLNVSAKNSVNPFNLTSS